MKDLTFVHWQLAGLVKSIKFAGASQAIEWKLIIGNAERAVGAKCDNWNNRAQPAGFKFATFQQWRADASIELTKAPQ